MNFDEAFEALIGHEGGYQNNPKDRGNWTSGRIGFGELRGTKYGISAMSYPGEDILGMTLERAKQLYRRDFWGKAACDALPPECRFDVFDAAVNSGVERAIKWLQHAVGAVADGDIGPQTMLAITHTHPARINARFNGHRLEFMADNPAQWAEFGRGAARRIARNLKAA